MKRLSIEWFIEKYGDEDGDKRYKSYKVKQSIASSNRNTLEGFIERYGVKEGNKRYDSFRYKSKHTLLKYIEKYGDEEGSLKWDEYILTKKRTSKRSIEYWLIQCDGDYEEAKESLRVHQTRDKKWYIKEFGEEAGIARWTEKNKKQSILANKLVTKGFLRGTSKISQTICWYVYNNILKEEDKQGSHFTELNSEFYIDGYLYDFINSKLKVCIEYNGDFWHCNPKYIKEDYIHPVKKISAKEIWLYDKKKLNKLKERGYKVLVIWENEWKDNPEHIKTLIKKLFKY